MTEAIAAQLAALASMSRVQLRAEWRRLYRASPPRLKPDLLARGITYALQSKLLGGHDRMVEAELSNLAKRNDEGAQKSVRRIRTGARLIRFWKGVTHVVLVTDAGYEFAGQTYRSLSAIAQIITGTHWSGPRFFGLKTRRKARSNG